MRITAVVTLMLFLGLTFPASGELELGNLIINRTQTRFGQDFHRYFVTMWEAPGGLKDYKILIRERASARWGSMIMIYVNDIPVYRAFLGFRTREMKEIVKKGVELTQMSLYRLSVDKQGAEDEDLAGDGL